LYKKSILSELRKRRHKCSRDDNRNGPVVFCVLSPGVNGL